MNAVAPDSVAVPPETPALLSLGGRRKVCGALTEALRSSIQSNPQRIRRLAHRLGITNLDNMQNSLTNTHFLSEPQVVGLMELLYAQDIVLNILLPLDNEVFEAQRPALEKQIEAQGALISTEMFARHRGLSDLAVR